jgi:hypothetical protein
MNLITLIRLFIKANGRRPSPNELSELQKKAMAPKSADVIQFPSGGKDRVPVNEQFGGIGSLDEFKKAEDAYEETSKGTVDSITKRMEKIKEMVDELTEMDIKRKNIFRPKDDQLPLKGQENIFRIKKGLSTKIKLNNIEENRQFAKDLIGGKSDEFNSLKAEDRKEILDRLEDQITMDDTEIPFAKGGLANMLRL